MKTFLTALCLSIGWLTISATTTASNEATDLALQARFSDSVTISYYTPQGATKVTFTDREWQERLARILETSSFEPRELCLCVAYPKIEFSNQGTPLGQLSVHHGDKIRTYGGYAKGDYFVGVETGKAINDLAMEKKPLTQSTTNSR